MSTPQVVEDRSPHIDNFLLHQLPQLGIAQTLHGFHLIRAPCLAQKFQVPFHGCPAPMPHLPRTFSKQFPDRSGPVVKHPLNGIPNALSSLVPDVFKSWVVLLVSFYERIQFFVDNRTVFRLRFRVLCRVAPLEDLPQRLGSRSACRLTYLFPLFVLPVISVCKTLVLFHKLTPQ